MLTAAGVRGDVSVTAALGNLSLGTSLTATQVTLTADGGTVTIAGVNGSQKRS